MNGEAYIEGFCKAAEAYGVDPVELAKFAQTASPKTREARWSELTDGERSNIEKRLYPHWYDRINPGNFMFKQLGRFQTTNGVPQGVSAPASSPIKKPTPVANPAKNPEPVYGRAKWNGLTPDEQKYYDKRIFPHWYDRINPVNYLMQGLAEYMTTNGVPKTTSSAR